MREKRGMFFSTDALIAIVIIFLVILIAYPLSEESKRESGIHYDFLSTLSKIKVGESKNSYVVELVNKGLISDLNKSLLEQVGEFYVTNISLARNLMNSLLLEVKSERNLGVWFGNKLISSSNASAFETSREVDVARQIISGISEGENITGFSARAFLTNALQKKYFYFGGYVGDGNLTQKVSYEGNITSANLELAISEDFDLYVNSQFEGHYLGYMDQITPVSYNISVEKFHSGDNLIELRGNSLHIAGGFIKIVYESDVEYKRPTRKYLPGVKGLINLYDGFYVPGNLTSLNIYLHMNSTKSSVFLNIGNITIFKNATRDEESLNFSNVYLSGLLDYKKLSEETIPFRLGLENVSYFSYGKADAISVSDISGSMAPSCLGASWWCCFSRGGCSTQNVCQTCGGTWEDKIGATKSANNVFIDIVLNYSQNRVGLVAYNTTVPNSTYHALSNKSQSLKNTVSSWKAGGTTCICCGINRAVNDLVSVKNNSAFQSIVLMSDGLANVRCSQQGTGRATQDAIKAACDAHSLYNITFYTIGFGSDVDEATLQAIASCGGGEYYYTDINELAKAYEKIANSIISRYMEQKIKVEGNLWSELYADSYLEFAYNETQAPYGLILSVESAFDNPSSGKFSAPGNSSFVETIVTSYSGSKWTDKVIANNNLVYNLSKYGSDFIKLGDPFVVNIPNSFVYAGQVNVVNLTTAVSPTNSSEGSSANKIVYTVAREFSSFSPIVAVADGCYWHIQFEDNSETNVKVPSEYAGTDRCDYSEGNSSGMIANENDALQLAVRNLLRKLDFDSDGKVDVLFTEQQLKIKTDEIVGIPFNWATEVQVRIWN